MRWPARSPRRRPRRSPSGSCAARPCGSTARSRRSTCTSSTTPSATGHISGVYQWVTKVYEAQVFNYGPRTVYDIMIPEPGAFLLEAFRRRRTAAIELEKPAAFEITPNQLDEYNYQTYIAAVRRHRRQAAARALRHRVLRLQHRRRGRGPGVHQLDAHRRPRRLPGGPRHRSGQVVAVWDDWSVDVVIGQRAHRFEGGASWVWSTRARRGDGLSAVGDGHRPGRRHRRRGRGDLRVDRSRASTCGAPTPTPSCINAYRARLSEYEAKLAELEAQAPAEIVSGPAQRNRALMIDEVKRASHLDPDRAALRHVRRHRQRTRSACRRSSSPRRAAKGRTRASSSRPSSGTTCRGWHIPYFWGRKSGWLDKVVIEDDDADFEAFLKAGFVRVQIPIRPGFVDAVDHFRLFGDPWLGGSLPAISDDTYLPIATEIAEKLGRPGNEVPVGRAVGGPRADHARQAARRRPAAAVAEAARRDLGRGLRLPGCRASSSMPISIGMAA